MTDFVDDAEAPVAELNGAVKQFRHSDMAVPQNGITGQRPIARLNTRRIENYDFASVERHFADQFAIRFVSTIEHCEPCVNLGVGDGHLVAVEP